MSTEAPRVFLTHKDSKGDWARFVEEAHPGVHEGNIELQILLGPDSKFLRYELGNLRSNRLQITRSVYGPGGWTRPHSHPDHEHAYYVIRGQALVKVGDQERVLGAGEVAYIPKGTLHGYKAHGSEPVELLDIHAYEQDDP
ncbi:MAG: cupin domain-containing protein [Chloroflexi bacterium]|nr:cupin domain-containing protein [Chloroflexota bacterium]